MEQPFRCNNQTGGYCRAVLTEEAVVTTCSHIFCLACSKKVGLSDARLDHRICPVCSTRLPNTDDAVQTLLNPTEEYKTSVLSGLGPTSIIECAGRALAFWTYQTTQEISYQQHVTKNLTERYSHLSQSMDKVIHDANSEIQGLQNKIQGFSIDHKSLEQKYAEVVDLYREKSRKHAQAQKLYDTLKQKYQAGQMQSAASANVAQAIESIDAERRPETFNVLPDPRPRYPDTTTAPYIEGRHPRPSSLHGSIEQLHPHQRSGSSAVGSTGAGDHLRMPPPERQRASRTANLPSTETPLHRVALPGTSRATANRSSQIPTARSRNNALHHPPEIPTLMTRSHLPPPQKINGSTPNSHSNGNGMNPNPSLKIGRSTGGTSGAFDDHASRFDQYRAPGVQHSSSRAETRGDSRIPFSTNYLP